MPGPSHRERPGVPKEAELRFRTGNDNAFGQRVWGGPYECCQLCLRSALSASLTLRVEAGVHNGSVIKPAKQHRLVEAPAW